jgi:hypothetical protein
MLGGNVDWDGQHCRFCRFFVVWRALIWREG